MCVFRRSFSVFLPPHALSIHPILQKMTAFYIYVNCALQICFDPFNLSNVLNYLKSLLLLTFLPLLKHRRNLRSLKHTASLTLVSILSLCLFMLRSLSKFRKSYRFGFKVPFKPANETKFSSSKDPIPTDGGSYTRKLGPKTDTLQKLETLKWTLKLKIIM